MYVRVLSCRTVAGPEILRVTFLNPWTFCVGVGGMGMAIGSRRRRGWKWEAMVQGPELKVGPLFMCVHWTACSQNCPALYVNSKPYVSRSMLKP